MNMNSQDTMGYLSKVVAHPLGTLIVHRVGQLLFSQQQRRGNAQGLAAIDKAALLRDRARLAQRR
jgi:hypothetical protein